ncbi:MAG: hypothetical protein CVU35_03060 [Betaproteobacteria bacterium HGW-Betaproteobacteria-8]|nr:MAG: hypothetical protein CVU35_03060 [Betaproteobacteria bacterium HGW-Betaproteobacteria-8]
MCVFLGLSHSSVAGPRSALVVADASEDKIVQPAEEAGSEQVQDLNGVSLEQRVRLRMDLNNYSRSSDPIHSHIQDRRRSMNKGIQERFFGADKDTDGVLSRQEVVDSLPQVARHYNQVDLDEDGFISINELVAYQAKLLERQRAGELRILQAKEAELKALQSAEQDEVLSKQTPRPKLKNKQAEIEGKPAL